MLMLCSTYLRMASLNPGTTTALVVAAAIDPAAQIQGEHETHTGDEKDCWS
jgi:hypothetical protein